MQNSTGPSTVNPSCWSTKSEASKVKNQRRNRSIEYRGRQREREGEQAQTILTPPTPHPLPILRSHSVLVPNLSTVRHCSVALCCWGQRTFQRAGAIYYLITAKCSILTNLTGSLLSIQWTSETRTSTQSAALVCCRLRSVLHEMLLQ